MFLVRYIIINYNLQPKLNEHLKLNVAASNFYKNTNTLEV